MYKVKVGGDRHNNYCFETVTKLRYLLVGLFHDLTQSPLNDICNVNYSGCIRIVWSRNRVKSG